MSKENHSESEFKYRDEISNDIFLLRKTIKKWKLPAQNNEDEKEAKVFVSESVKRRTPDQFNEVMWRAFRVTELLMKVNIGSFLAFL